MQEKYKILIAEDSEISIKMITEIMQIIGDECELIYARNGNEACEKAFEYIPDLILMDVVMPELNGIEAIKQLRLCDLTIDIPIIVLSATESLESAYLAGANDFISKPFHKYALLIKVRSAIHLVQKIKEINKQKLQLEKIHEEVVLQRDKIVLQQKDIIDDIKYSKRIQKAILPTDELINNILPDHFILNMPRNIVSGDFYWAESGENGKILAVADCTGHGISGAFMTMAGTAFLNEINKLYPAYKSNEILFELRNLVMKLLKQKGETGEAADGMDISLITLNKNSCQFAGANNPLYHIHDNELTLHKGDRMPIGIHMNFERPFSNFEITLSHGDMIYLSTDGYADQFGGPHNKKFRYGNFQNLLLEIHKFPMKQQHDILLERINSWKGNNDQVDDIMILGFRY